MVHLLKLSLKIHRVNGKEELKQVPIEEWNKVNPTSARKLVHSSLENIQLCQHLDIL